MSAMIATRPLLRNPHAGNAGERGRVWLDRLFAGDFPFPAVPVAALPPSDRSIIEHDVVSRAVGCRDLFVIHADIAAGERVIADIARAAADRVLILTPNPAAADRIAERLLKYGASILRTLADDENPVRPSPVVNKVTSAAIGHASAEQAKKEAAAAVVAAEQRIAVFAVVSKAIARLREVTDLLKKHDANIADLTAHRDRLEADVKAESDTPFAAAIAKLKTEHAEVTTQLTAELQTVTAHHTEKETILAQVRHHHADATRKPGLLARLFGGKPKPGAPDPAELEKQVHTLEAEVATLAAQVTDLQGKMNRTRPTDCRRNRNPPKQA
jgi:hypothetical protein